MNRIKLYLSLTFLSIFLTFNPVKSQVIIKIKPARPAVIIVKPAKPRPGRIWLEGHWKWNKRHHKYVWVTGRWMKAKRGHRWLKGHWIIAPGGHRWVPGHWKHI